MMALSYEQISQERITPLFYKLLGTGGGSGFNWYPDFGTYGFIATWKNKNDAESFFENSIWYQEYAKKASGKTLIWLKPVKSHGKWSGMNPFSPSSTPENEGPVAVLTRATIKWKYLPLFWSKVPKVSSIHNLSEGLLYSKGIGEYPLKQQATFSLWKNMQSMKAFSYRGKHHRKVIDLTRRLKWYSEELFARFRVEKIEGNLVSIKNGQMTINPSSTSKEEIKG